MEERLITYVAQMADAASNALEESRASLDDGVERPGPQMSADDLRRNLERAWANIDRVYQEVGAAGNELRRNRVEAIGPRP